MNNWKNTKLSGNTLEHSDKLHLKFKLFLFFFFFFFNPPPPPPPPHPPPKKKQAMKVSFYKTWTDNWKNNKLLGNTFEHSDKPQSKFQCRSLFRFWVIKLPTEPKKSVKVSFYKKWTNNWKTPNFQKILLNIWTTLSQTFNALACFIFELLSRLHNPKNLWRCLFMKRERTIEKTPNF